MYGFRDIHTFTFSTKIQDGRQKWGKLKFFPFAQNTLVLPCGSKIRSKSLYLVRFSRYSHFFCKNPRWPPKVAKIEIFPLCIGYYPVGKIFARNLSILYGFRDIHTFSFSSKIQYGRKKWRKWKFFPFAQGTFVLLCGSKIRSKSLYLVQFSRYSHFFIFRKNPRWPPKVAKIEIVSPWHYYGYSCTTLWVKNSLEIALSLTVFEIFTFFHFPLK